MNKYHIGTGYFSRPNHGAEEFFKIWYANTLDHSQPKRITILSCGGCAIPGAPGQWINLDGDIGHVGQILSGAKKFPYPSGALTICALALLAYLDECDFIFKEQDLLAFGDWPGRIYSEADAGGHEMMIGRQKCMPCAMSLMLIRHSFILEFVRWFLSSEAEVRGDSLSEHKLARWQASNPGKIGYFSFGYDRDRPFNMDDDVWYAQKYSIDELKALEGAGLIGKFIYPEGVKYFTNDTPPENAAEGCRNES